MKREEFFKQLRERMSGFPSQTIESTISYYDELIDDAIEDGKSEEATIESFGSVESIVNTLLKEVSISKLVKEKVTPKRKLKSWEIVLIILGSPIWVSLGIALLSVCFSLYVGFWSTIVALWAADLAFMVGGIAAVIGSFTTFAVGAAPQATFFLGAGLVGIGLSIVLGFAFVALTKLIAQLGAKIITGIKKIFVGKGK
jgi:uncharacterized membrane protein